MAGKLINLCSPSFHTKCTTASSDLNCSLSSSHTAFPQSWYFSYFPFRPDSSVFMAPFPSPLTAFLMLGFLGLPYLVCSGTLPSHHTLGVCFWIQPLSFRTKYNPWGRRIRNVKTETFEIFFSVWLGSIRMEMVKKHLANLLTKGTMFIRKNN